MTTPLDTGADTWHGRRVEIIRCLALATATAKLAAELHDWRHALDAAQESAKLAAALLVIEREGQ